MEEEEPLFTAEGGVRVGSTTWCRYHESHTQISQKPHGPATLLWGVTCTATLTASCSTHSHLEKEPAQMFIHRQVHREDVCVDTIFIQP